MTINWRTELPHLLCLAALFAVAFAVWPFAPERMPVHWNLQGEVDRFGGRAEGLLALPAIAVGMYLLFLLLPRLDPMRANYDKFGPTFTLIRWWITGFMAVVYGIVLVSTFEPRFNGTLAGSIAIGALFIALGNSFGKLRPNWFIGIRTPWTLSSRLSWARTHRAGGWLFILIGVMIAATGYSRSLVALWSTLAVLLGGTIGLVAYSFLVWQHDPQREPVASKPSSSAL